MMGGKGVLYLPKSPFQNNSGKRKNRNWDSLPGKSGKNCGFTDILALRIDLNP